MHIVYRMAPDKTADKERKKDMDFLKELLGEELFKQFESKVNEHNGNEANKDKQIKIANLASGEYVGKGKYEALDALLKGKETELATANGLIEQLKKDTKGNEELQGKITQYESTVADLQGKLQETEIKYAFELMLMDAGVTDKDEREFLTYKYQNKLKEEGKTLELDENKHIKGAEGIVESMKTMRPKAFESAGTGRLKVLGDNRLPEGSGEVTVTKDQFLKMGYEERLKLKQDNEELYKQLTKK